MAATLTANELESTNELVASADGVVASFQSADEANERTRVLIVDGNATQRKILRHTFSSLGWETSEAKVGAEALRMVGERPFPNAILLDIELGEIDGFGSVAS